MARVSLAVGLIALAVVMMALLTSRQEPSDRQASLTASGIDAMPVGSTSEAARAKRERDTMAP